MCKVTGSDNDSFESLEVTERDEEGQLNPKIPDMKINFKENRSFDMPNESYHLSKFEDQNPLSDRQQDTSSMLNT